MNAAKMLPLLEVFTQQYSPYNKEEVGLRPIYGGFQNFFKWPMAGLPN